MLLLPPCRHTLRGPGVAARPRHPRLQHRRVSLLRSLSPSERPFTYVGALCSPQTGDKVCVSARPELVSAEGQHLPGTRLQAMPRLAHSRTAGSPRQPGSHHHTACRASRGDAPDATPQMCPRSLVTGAVHTSPSSATAAWSVSAPDPAPQRRVRLSQRHTNYHGARRAPPPFRCGGG